MTNQTNTLWGTRQAPTKLIFVVDDDVDIGQFIVQVIEEETPHHAHLHTTGLDALQAIRIHTPHLFILDYGLPDITGLQLHDQLHTFDHVKEVPTLLISAEKPPMNEVRKRQITFLAKPFGLTQLLGAIKRLLSRVT